MHAISCFKNVRRVLTLFAGVCFTIFFKISFAADNDQQIFCALCIYHICWWWKYHPTKIYFAHFSLNIICVRTITIIVRLWFLKYANVCFGIHVFIKMAFLSARRFFRIHLRKQKRLTTNKYYELYIKIRASSHGNELQM